MIETLDQIPHLFVSLGDGSVISYVIGVNKLSAQPELTERRKVVLGTQPTILKKFSANGGGSGGGGSKSLTTSNIFACSDRPSVISSANQKLVYSSVNLKQVEYMCELNSRGYPNCLALLSSGVLRIGPMDSIQKLHIRSVPLNETVRRIAYQADTQSFGVITMRIDVMSASGELKPLVTSASNQCPSQLIARSNGLQPIDQSQSTAAASMETQASSSCLTAASFNGQFDTHVQNSFLILDQNTFEVLHSVQFQPSEFALSIMSISLDSDNTYYIVGCSTVIDDEPEPKQGRVIVFKYNSGENKLAQVCEKEIRGAPYCLASFNGKLLVSVSNALKLYEFKEGELNLLASHSDNVFIVHMKCKNDFIFIGDMMKSCAVLTYRADTNAFEVVARDYTPVWLSSMEMIDDDNFIMSDSFLNVISLKKDRFESFILN